MQHTIVLICLFIGAAAQTRMSQSELQAVTVGHLGASIETSTQPPPVSISMLIGEVG